MAYYIVMDSPDRRDSAYIRDGFRFFAFMLPPVWLLWHRLWIEALAVIAVAIALAVASGYFGFGATGSFLSLLVSIYVGLEAPALEAAALRRRGWLDAGAVDARSRAEAEIRHIYGRDDAAGPPVAALPALSGGIGRPHGPALGLFSYPGGV